MGLLRSLYALITRGVHHRDADTFGGIDFQRLQQVLHHTVRNRQYFCEALSHRSYLQVTENESAVSNERLEFLGDAILNLVVAEYVFHRDTSAAEGDLTKIRSRLVNRKALTAYARHRHLADFILMSPSASQVPGRGMETILADAFEAMIGAIYLDGGYEDAKRFVQGCLLEALTEGTVKMEDENFKSRLLEQAQAGGFGTPRYSTVNEEGPDHDRTFTVEVFIGNVSYGVGHGKNKKDAEQAAAERALQQFRFSAKQAHGVNETGNAQND
ncbi:MAG: ribonuclease III [Ignavibacteria bacterium]|nr:ribonuclease III [Ignavibacteria bacterium]